MYFPIGWPSFFNAHSQQCSEHYLKEIKFNRNRSLFVTISERTLYLWKTKPRLVLTTWDRDEKSITNDGANKEVYWNPDCSMLAVLTCEGVLLLLNVYEIDNQHIYKLVQSNSNIHPEQCSTQPIPKIEIGLERSVRIRTGITCVAARLNELFLGTMDGFIEKCLWDGEIEEESAVNIRALQFCVDLETAVGSLLKEDKEIYITKMECSPVLGGFAIILSDGRAGFLSAETAQVNPSEVVGIFAKDLTGAVCVSINIKYQLICFGCSNGRGYAYTFDEVTGGLILSHEYARNYHDSSHNLGGLVKMAWTPDGCALAAHWSNSGLAVWSVFGALLVFIENNNYGSDTCVQEKLRLHSMDWGHEGYELLLVPKTADTESHPQGEIMSLKFVKSTLTVNPCMANRQHLFLQGEDSIYLNTGDIMLQSEHGALINDQASSPSLHFSNKHWQIIQAPQSYITPNWPIRYAAIDDTSKYIAVAGVYGYAHFSLARRKWRMFGNETQERSIICRGGLTWWHNYLIVGCYNLESDIDEVRFHRRQANLDVGYALSVKLPAPIFLINTFNDILLVYCADCSVSFYNLTAVDLKVNATGIEVVKISETTLVDFLMHPVTVVSLSLTSLKNEQSRINLPSEGREAHSLIANVAGRLFMLQKDKPVAERKSRKVDFLPPVVLASCVENVWYLANPTSCKQHLEESLWLACGSQGIQAWLPLFPQRERIQPHGFLSKRIMLHFELQLYPLAVLFEDAVILGISSDSMSDEFVCMSPGNNSAMPFPYFCLQRNTQVYLPQILKQLLRRNLGVHALDIARSCTNLPYFAHVLELMLHEVLEKEATASNPIPDPLLPRVVAFIQEFPQFLETVCHCARKTEVALWPHLFAVVGNPIELFKSCHLTGKLDTAASYLIIIQSLEHPSVSRQHATILLEAALEASRWQLARDLVRFLTTIGDSENESPPRTPVYHHKPSFHQTHHSSIEIDDSMTAPVLIPVQRQSSRPLTATTSHPRTASTTNMKERHTPNERAQRPPSLKLTKRESLEKFSTSATHSKSVDSCEQFYAEIILNRHARKLLTSFQLMSLGRFAAYMQFDLVQWLTKERWRAAGLDNMIEALLSLHEQFSWSYPTQQMCSYISSTSSLPPPSISDTEYEFKYDAFSPVLLSETDDDAFANTEDNIDACLVSSQERDHNTTTEMSETESHVTSDCTDNHGETLNIAEEKIKADYLEILSSHYWGPSESRNILRYLFAVFLDSVCLDWAVILAVMLCDFSSLDLLVEKINVTTDVSYTKMQTLWEKISDLMDWTEDNCPAYHSLLSIFQAKCRNLCVHDNTPKENSIEVKPAEIGPVSPAEKSEHTLTNQTTESVETNTFVEEEVVDENNSDCTIS